MSHGKTWNARRVQLLAMLLSLDGQLKYMGEKLAYKYVDAMTIIKDKIERALDVKKYVQWPRFKCTTEMILVTNVR